MKTAAYTEALNAHSVRIPVNPFTLTFTDQYLNDTFTTCATQRSLFFVRLTLALAISLYFFFALLDPYIMNAVQMEIMWIRVFSILFFAGVIILTYREWGTVNFQFLMSMVVLGAGVGIISMILLSESTGGYLYYAALILAVMYAHSLLRLRFIYASFTTWLVILVYALTTLWLDVTPFYIYLNNIFFLFSANIMGMFASYWIEFYMKAEFIRERALEEKTIELETELERKTEELNAARDIQLSILPQSSPRVPRYSFSFSMHPATEVGGDYYDYIVNDDGAVTFAIGDATGHGLQASVIVTAIKLLFSEHAGHTELTEFLRRASKSISLMGFRKIFLAFAIGRLHHHKLEFAGAGMPPALIYREQTGKVEEVSLKGFPLGSTLTYHYIKSETYLELGDTVLLMTDGFPELSGPDSSMIGYETVRRLFAEAGGLPPDQIVERLNNYAGSWLAGKPQNDDITFFVLKRTAETAELVSNDDSYSSSRLTTNELAFPTGHRNNSSKST